SPAAARHCVVAGSWLVWQEPPPLHVSGLSQTVSALLPHVVPAGSKLSEGQLPAPSQFSATSHSPAAARHCVVAGSWLVWHAPPPLNVSGLSQMVSALLPHVVPAGSKPSEGQLPLPSQFSVPSHSPAAARHCVVAGSWLVWHAPPPLQVSGLSQTVSALLPHV